ncbi:glutaredoxin 3 [Corallococcus llansteffanensis]|uniref:Glutaredoxin n=1 Tax=Corallococcus llansteffanensis TaxID=2316731 RepID=A0A3A8PAL6_9BACT|nr:glutaredoxin 3 [Corallococcus llansteffanensis]RKH49512.1 glutaredoxin 3 [Corallococcus llansteffanensis]
MPDVIVYMKAMCPYSRQAMALLREKGCAFQKVDVANDEQRREEMMERCGRHTVPQIFIAGRHIGGCDDLYALEECGELDALLGGAGASTAP